MALHPVCVLVLSMSVVDGAAEGGKPFGPVLSLAEQAHKAGLRCVRISARRAEPA
jgi:hypothetical protein